MRLKTCLNKIKEQSELINKFYSVFDAQMNTKTRQSHQLCSMTLSKCERRNQRLYILK